MITKPNFILGVGCQKGGTSWLYHYLGAHPEVRMSTIKELHVFDALFMPRLFDAHIAQCQKQIDKARETGMQGSKASLEDLTDRLAMYRNLGHYKEYFLRKANESSGDGIIRLVGEITPTYAALDALHFGRIKDLIGNDFNIKVVFLMRNPIDRIWSQQRMIEGKPRRSDLAGLIVPGILSEQFYSNPKVVVRTAYERTVRNLEQVFKEEELFMGFYETLFTERELKRLCGFLGISYKEGDCQTRVNASRNSNQFPEAASILAARAYYDETYTFCASRFDENFIRSIWRYY